MSNRVNDTKHLTLNNHPRLYTNVKIISVGYSLRFSNVGNLKKEALSQHIAATLCNISPSVHESLHDAHRRFMTLLKMEYRPGR